MPESVPLLRNRMNPLPARHNRLGQHFLVDRRAVGRIVGALALRGGEPLLEIGPGRGALTEALIEAGGRIAAVELDSRLAEQLRRRFEASRLVLLHGDILRIDLSEIRSRLGDTQRPMVVAGNLPYGISKPVTQKLIRERACVDRAVLMFQREVALRLTAGPGSRRYGPLGILAGQFYRIDRLFDLAPRAFRPPPAVVSTVTTWHRRENDGLDADDESRMRSCLAVCFARRRRTLRNNLRAAFDDDLALERLLVDAGLDGELRAEAIPPAGFLRLARKWNRTRE